MKVGITRFIRAVANAILAFIKYILVLLHLRRGKQPSSDVPGLSSDGGDKPLSAPPPPAPSLKIVSCLAVRKTLVLDLDETLVHSTEDWALNYDFTVSLHLRTTDGSGLFRRLRTPPFFLTFLIFPFPSFFSFPFFAVVPVVFYVQTRPYLMHFLKKVSRWYDVCVFTASVRAYAEPLIAKLDPDHKRFRATYFRDSCKVDSFGHATKDLEALNFDLSRTILLDDSGDRATCNKDNVIPLRPWMGDDAYDEELINALPVLYALRYVSDVRSVLCLRHL